MDVHNVLAEGDLVDLATAKPSYAEKEPPGKNA